MLLQYIMARSEYDETQTENPFSILLDKQQVHTNQESLCDQTKLYFKVINLLVRITVLGRLYTGLNHVSWSTQGSKRSGMRAYFFVFLLHPSMTMISPVILYFPCCTVFCEISDFAISFPSPFLFIQYLRGFIMIILRIWSTHSSQIRQLNMSVLIRHKALT